MPKTSKEDLIALLSNPKLDLSQESIEKISGVIKKINEGTHDEAIATTQVNENPVDEDLIKKVTKKLRDDLHKDFTSKDIKTVLESMGIDSSFKSIEISGQNRSIAILVDKNGKAWAMPRSGAKYQDLGKYFDYFGAKDDICGSQLNRPASGKMINGQFIVINKGRLGSDREWDRTDKSVKL